MVVNKSVSSLLNLLEWRDHRLSAGGPTVNYNICHAGFKRTRNESQINRKETNEQ